MTDTAVFVVEVIVAENVVKTPVPEATGREPATSFPHHCLQIIEA
jgi:hypothetical protein